MANYKEIVTKAVVSKGKKLFTSTNNVMVNNPSTILGCWVINHNFNGVKENNKIIIDGSYDVNIWYSYDNDTKTNVFRESNSYQEIVNLNKKGNSDTENEEIIVRSLKQPTVIKADINNNQITYTIEKELGIELVGNTKVKIAVDEDEEEWELLDDDLGSDVDKVIDNEVVEEFLE